MADRTTTINLFIVSLETSGDLLASYLITTLSSLNQASFNHSSCNQNLYFEGITGPHTKKLNVTTFASIDQFSTMGISAIIKKIPSYLRLKKALINRILEGQFDVVITIDSSTFNFSLAKQLKKKGFKGKLIHYVCPTIWIYRKKRKETLVQNYDLLLNLFSFEDPLFTGTTLPTLRLGHPFISIDPLPKTPPLSTIAIFPGSRLSIIEKMLPLQYEAALHYHLPIAVSIVNSDHLPIIKSLAPKASVFFEEEKTAILAKTVFAIATSGTVNLELALYEIPTITVYLLSKLDVFLAKYLLKINLPYYSLPNLLLQQPLFPEVYGASLTPQDLIKAIAYLKDHPPAFNSNLLKKTLAPSQDLTYLKQLIVARTPKTQLIKENIPL